MLPSVILGLGLLIAIILLMRWYANADPATLKRVIKLTAIWALGLVAVFLAVTGRFAAAFGLVMGIVAFGWRVLNMLAMAQQLRGLFGGLGNPFARTSHAQAGQSSQVEAHFLTMTLDHDTGSMDGQVRTGQFQGRLLSAMRLPELLELRSEVSTDADSLGLLEAYLDRAHIGWRDEAGPEQDAGHKSQPSGSSGPMTRQDAYLALGLEHGASKKEIKAAYRQLMAKVHPDRGGSAYLAAKINEAKDLLLND